MESMKALYLYIILSVLSLGNLQAQDKKVSYLSSITIDKSGIVKDGRSVRFSMDVDLSGVRINAQHTVALIPAIVSKDGCRELAFPPLVVDGRVRNKIYLRAQEIGSVEYPPYHDGSAKAIINGRNGKEQHYLYNAQAPYERWMLDGNIEVREEIHGCTNCGMGKSSRLLATEVLPAYQPDYRLENIAPCPQQYKGGVYSCEAHLMFPHDSYRIAAELKDNRAQLDTIINSLSRLINDDKIDITGISITGYASPEGTEKHNMRLSEKRAEALAEYIVKNTKIERNSIKTEGKGEDWNGFIRLLETHKELEGWSGMNELIKRYPGRNDMSESRFRAVNAKSYKYMFGELYPSLRRNTYRVDYKIKEFKLEDAKELIRTRPELLSLYEMFGVAESYSSGTPEYDDVMTIAMKYFPDSAAVLSSIAVSAISRNDFSRAIRILEGSQTTGSTPALLNTLGVAYARSKEYEKAEKALDAAAKRGSEAAKRNLNEIRRVIEQL